MPLDLDDTKSNCQPAFPGSWRRPSVSPFEVTVQQFPQSRIRWTITLLSASVLAVALTALTQIVAEGVPSTLLPSNNGTSQTPVSQGEKVQAFHLALMFLNYLTAALQATSTHVAAFVRPACRRDQVKRVVGVAAHLLAAFSVNTFFCLAHCSQMRKWIGPWLITTWAAYVGSSIFLSGHIGVSTAVIEQPEDMSNPEEQNDTHLLSKEHTQIAKVLSYFPMHWISVCRPSQLEHEQEEQGLIPWRLKEEEIIGTLSMVAIFSLALGVMFAVCNRQHVGSAYVSHWFGALAAAVVYLPLVRRAMELARQPSFRTVAATGLLCVFALPAVFLACMTEGWGLGAVFMAAVFQLNQSALPVSLRKLSESDLNQRIHVLPKKYKLKFKRRKKERIFSGEMSLMRTGDLSESLLGGDDTTWNL